MGSHVSERGWTRLGVWAPCTTTKGHVLRLSRPDHALATVGGCTSGTGALLRWSDTGCVSPQSRSETGCTSLREMRGKSGQPLSAVSCRNRETGCRFWLRDWGLTKRSQPVWGPNLCRELGVHFPTHTPWDSFTHASLGSLPNWKILFLLGFMI